MGFLSQGVRLRLIRNPFGYGFISLFGGLLAAIAFVAAMGSAGLVLAQATQNSGRPNDTAKATAAGPAADSGEIELLHVQGNVSMLAGAGGNITVQTGSDGILLVDTGLAAMSDKVLEALRRLSKAQVTYIINTDDRSDHIGGNEVFAHDRTRLGNQPGGAGERFHRGVQHDPGQNERADGPDHRGAGEGLAQRPLLAHHEDALFQRRRD